PSRDDDSRREDAGRIQLRDVAARKGAGLTYRYDFGDDWQHELIVEEAACPDAEPGKAVCIAGERACPPEDCGGVWGYAELLDALDDPANPDLKSAWNGWRKFTARSTRSTSNWTRSMSGSTT